MEPSKDMTAATFDQIFTITEGEVTDVEKAQMDEYLSNYVVPPENRCIKCDSKLIGTLTDQLLGTTFEWGMVHGEGHCRKCGWPARYYHHPKEGPLESFTLMLQVHPKHVTKAA